MRQAEWWLPGARGEGKWGSVGMGAEFLSGMTKKLEMDGSGGCTTM